MAGLGNGPSLLRGRRRGSSRNQQITSRANRGGHGPRPSASCGIRSASGPAGRCLSERANHLMRRWDAKVSGHGQAARDRPGCREREPRRHAPGPGVSAEGGSATAATGVLGSPPSLSDLPRNCVRPPGDRSCSARSASAWAFSPPCSSSPQGWPWRTGAPLPGPILPVRIQP